MNQNELRTKSAVIIEFKEQLAAIDRALACVHCFLDKTEWSNEDHFNAYREDATRRLNYAVKRLDKCSVDVAMEMRSVKYEGDQ